MRIAAWAVLAMMVGVGRLVCAATLEQRLALYDSLDVAEIVWGQESEADDHVGVLDPAYFTADVDRVEVLMFPRYTNFVWQRSVPFTSAWRESLPDGVVVNRMPKGVGVHRNHQYAIDWKVHQRVYLAGRMLGIEDEVHAEMVAIISRAGTGLGSHRQAENVARKLGIDPQVFVGWMEAPVVRAHVRMASMADFDRMLADTAQGGSRKRSALAPAMIINGRYVVSADAIGDPGDAYRIANRIIRQELDAGRVHDGPTNDEEFTEWMAPREGEIFGRERFGKKLKFRGVYSHARRELWQLDAKGGVRRAYRLQGEGDGAYFEASDGGGSVRYTHVWRHSRQYVAFQGKDGPRRYGAFLLTDYLCDSETMWVGLPFRGHEAAFAFTPDGRVEARKGAEVVFGSWWLEAGNLNVSFGDLGIEVWPWKEAAAHVGFEVPQSAVTPWKSGEKAKSLGEGR